MLDNTNPESSFGERREWFRGGIFHRLPLAMIVVNRDGRIEAANAMVLGLLGYGEGELIGQSVDKLVPMPSRETHTALRAHYHADPDVRPMGTGRDLRALRRDGSTVAVEIALHPLQTGQGSMVLATIVDITERRRRDEQLRAMLEEKQLLLRELHHRVKNNLQMVDSLLDLQADRVHDAQAAALLRDSQHRIRAMSLVHRQLYMSDNFARVDFQEFLNALLPALAEAYAPNPDRIAFATDTHRIGLPIGAAIPCGLIVNELVSNALKHGFPAGQGGGIWIELAQASPAGAVLTVANDGRPIPPELDLDRTGTLGMRLVALLTSQLHGRLDIDRAARPCFRIVFPLDGD